MSSTTATITASRLPLPTSAYSSELCAKVVTNRSSFGSSTFSSYASFSELSAAVDAEVLSSASMYSRVDGGVSDPTD